MPPGTYTLSSTLDAEGFGYPNKSFPSGQTTGVAVSNANLIGQSVAISDPAPYAITSTPSINAVSPFDVGIVLDYGAITGTDNNGNTTEIPPFYQLQWTQSLPFPTGTPPADSVFTFPAGSTNGSGVLFLNNLTSGMDGTFQNGQVYYFRMRGWIGTGNSNNGPWATYGGQSSTPVTIGALSGAHTVSGQVNFTGAAHGPLFVGFFNPNTGSFYGQRISSPVSPQPYSVSVPDCNECYFVGIVDNNHDGAMDPGDFTNNGENGPPTVTVTASSSTQDLTIPSARSTVTLTTQSQKWTSPTNTSVTYGINLDVREANDLPVAVQLVSGPNVLHPVDMGRCADCGKVQFQYNDNLGGMAPTVGDTYGLNVTYATGTPETLNGTVTAVFSVYATSLCPQQTTFCISTTPTFSWNYPANAGDYTYQFRLMDSNFNTIWQIPSPNSNSNGFTSGQIPSTSGGSGIVWGTDPTNSSNDPSLPNLQSGQTYNWSIQTTDEQGNSATRQIWFTP